MADAVEAIAHPINLRVLYNEASIDAIEIIEVSPSGDWDMTSEYYFDDNEKIVLEITHLFTHLVFEENHNSIVVRTKRFYDASANLLVKHILVEDAATSKLAHVPKTNYYGGIEREVTNLDELVANLELEEMWEAHF